MGKMEQFKEIDLDQLCSEESTALTQSQPLSLSSQQLKDLAMLQGMLIAAYPNQEILPGTPDLWREEWTEIALKHGMGVLAEALKRHRKASSFLPSIADVHDQVKLLLEDRAAAKEALWDKCGECSNGMRVRTNELGEQVAYRCPCFLQWKSRISECAA